MLLHSEICRQQRYGGPCGGGNFMIAVHPITRQPPFFLDIRDAVRFFTFPLGFASPIRCHYTPHKAARHRPATILLPAIRNHSPGCSYTDDDRETPYVFHR